MKANVYPKCRQLLCALSYKRVCKHGNTGSCVCVPCMPHGGLSATRALEIRSGGGSGLNSLRNCIRKGDLQRFIKKKTYTPSGGKAGSRMIHKNIDCI